jgi:hypothetical protein
LDQDDPRHHEAPPRRTRWYERLLGALEGGPGCLTGAFLILCLLILLVSTLVG